MAVEVIGMYGSITGGTQNALATIDVPQDGVLVGIDWDLSCSLDAAEACDCELSFIATNQLVSNDVRGRLSSIAARAAVVTAVGVVVTFVQKWIGNFELTLAGGERLYLHASTTAGVTGNLRCNLFYDMGATIRRSARRR